MLELDIEPGLSLGKFRLGMRLSEAIQITNEYCTNSDPFNRVDIIYCKKDPLGNPISIEFDQGFKLQFNSVTQHLEQMEVFNTAPLILSHRGKKFCTPESFPSYWNVHDTFGPTVLGDFIREDGRLVYKLTYPGMALLFPIPKELEELCRGENEGLPKDCRHVPVSSIVLKENMEQSRVKIEPTPHIEATVTEGVDIQGAKIRFGSSPQEVLSEMGSPGAVYTKIDDTVRVRIPNSDDDTGDYFYNYFQLGLDILFDGILHIVKKFVFHTNFPSHYLFNCYVKCNFSVKFPLSCLVDAPRKILKKKPKLEKSVVPKKNGPKVVVRNFDDDDEEEEEEKEEIAEKEEIIDDFEINSNTSWEAVKAYLGEKGRPHIFESPAGSTKIYGFPGLAVEVLENGFLGCVYMFPIPK
mmetsp:Transcript_27201/g.41816  ORF Transcript_27201/g.41816 Transcript_27201/m.41816 type:complete len:410 (-) Transcript_27201:12-1241(-)|eukprot:CAMPEP_0117027266 /NCGR_PEP_ID=MMETSP0472-20121206/19948_1 /TAXON_ID=693140 ORGANISM="Tiarina fusus, Strain LIS" /NCGR_SAMPLE_ID=MMETSP0472 /ASSEMBLY_ACC=CAM_ASM_000603 /LENGTH=409 /DNA_ID=CAMNT_0004734467 /DNA_START=30 /DNA_END=1259 /DNA_ORIENTATION=-